MRGALLLVVVIAIGPTNAVAKPTEILDLDVQLHAGFTRLVLETDQMSEFGMAITDMGIMSMTFPAGVHTRINDQSLKEKSRFLSCQIATTQNDTVGTLQIDAGLAIDDFHVYQIESSRSDRARIVVDMSYSSELPYRTRSYSSGGAKSGVGEAAETSNDGYIRSTLESLLETDGRNFLSAGMVVEDGEEPDPTTAEPDEPASSPSQANEDVNETITEAVARFGSSSGGSPSEEDILILQVALDRLLLTDAMDALLLDGRLLLPLQELVLALDFAIETDAMAGTANGWFLSTNRIFSLNAKAGEVVVDGKAATFNSRLIELFLGDIYVDTRLLAEWFPMHFDINLAQLKVVVISEEPFPVELQRARDSLRSRVQQFGTPEDRDLPVLDLERRMFSTPFVNANAEISYRNDEEGNQISGRYDLFATSQLFYMDGQLFISGQHDDLLSQARVSLARRNEEGGILGPLDLTEVEFGDVFTPRMQLVSRTGLGRGFTASNMPLKTLTEFDQITLNGDLPQGWELELYRNEVLLDFRTFRPDSRYIFEDIPLLVGENRLRLTFFGPQGQVRNETQTFNVGADQIQPGSHLFRVSASQGGKTLLTGASRGSFGTSTLVEDEDVGAIRATGEYLYGINNRLSVGATVATLGVQGSQHNYAGGRVLASLGPVLGTIDVVKDFSGGWAGRVKANTSLGNTLITVEHSQLSDFESEEFRGSGALKSRSELRVDSTLNIAGRSISVGLTGSHDQREGGVSQNRADARVSTVFGRAAVSNTIRWTSSKTGGSTSTNTSGAILVGGQWRNARLRGQLFYDLDGSKFLRAASATAIIPLGERFQSQLGASLALAGGGEHTFSASVSTRELPVNLGLGVSMTSGGDIDIRLNSAFSFGLDPRTNSIHFDNRPLADAAALSALTFIDNNGDGIFDEGDDPIENVGFRIGRRQLQAYTDEAGVAFLTQLPVYSREEFEVAVNTLEDPYLMPVEPAYAINMRPGTAMTVDFPFVMTGEVDGTVFVSRDGLLSEVSRVRLQMVDQEGNIVEVQRSAYDGFYLFDTLPPGNYLLRVDPDQAERLGYNVEGTSEITIAGDGVIFSGRDFVLKAKE